MEIYNEENDEYFIYCDVCDKCCISLYYKNHLKSPTHTNNLIKIEKKIKITIPF